MMTAKVFQSGNSQAIRIPNEYRTEQTEFIIHKLGEGFYLIPTSDPWCFLRGSLGAAASEPEFERDQPGLGDIGEREEF